MGAKVAIVTLFVRVENRGERTTDYWEVVSDWTVRSVLDLFFPVDLQNIPPPSAIVHTGYCQAA